LLLRRLVRRAPLVMAVALCATSCPLTSLGPTIEVSGRAVAADGLLTVDDALRRAQVVVPAGHVLSAVTHRPLAGDHQPGQVLVDGHPAAADTLVAPGSVVTVVPGEDVTEPLTIRRVVVLPTNGIASLYVGGRVGTARVVTGSISGETLSRRVERSPHRGHLVAPQPLALTFDDGPDPYWTPRVLRLLAIAHVHATFCVVGREVAKHPELVRAIVNGGHTLCNHTWHHDEQLASRTPAVLRAELARTQAAVRRAAGVTPRLFRAPGGAWSPAVEREARRQGMTPLKWSVDPRDWTRPGARDIAVRVLGGLRPGAIVLLHDGGGERAQTLKALKFLLIRLTRQGWSFEVPRP
jgi:peptidoglycan/xylan/chitin deacetylase (PgdA/CDA1 family)